MLQRCSSCHTEKPLSDFHKSKNQKNGVKNQCKSCVSSAYRTHKDHVTSYNREYYKTHSDEIKEYAKSYRTKNPQVIKIWRANNREHLNAYGRSPKGSVHLKNYKARKRNAIGKFTSAEWVELLERCNYSCLRCGVTGVTLAADHIVPLKKGGTNFISNIQPLCKSCNSSKNVSIMDYRPSWLVQLYG